MEIDENVEPGIEAKGGQANSLSFRRYPVAVAPIPFTFPIRLSQGHLNLLATCPRKFQHTYLEQLATPIDPDQQERLLWGARFHWLVQQWQLGLPVEPLAREDARLQRWFADFVQAAPEILKLNSSDAQPLAESEHPRTLEWQGYLLTVVYDLLLTDRQQAKILDWKTYPRPQRSEWLRQNWQTRLYRFVLAETSDYEPEQMAMTYWFFQSNRDGASVPQSLTFQYDPGQHEQTRQDLTQLLQQLTAWLERYQQGDAFPQLLLGARECDRCNFAIRCDRVTISTDRDNTSDAETTEPPPQAKSPMGFALPALADIQEIPL